MPGVTLQTRADLIALGVRPSDMPRAILAADWQAGITPGNERLRVTLDGEPVPMAFAAASGPNGWVREFVAQGSGQQCQHTTDSITGERTRRGHVRIVGGDRAYLPDPD